MTFSAQVKQELCKQPLSRRCCAQAEAYGILLYCNTFQPRQVRIITESPQLKQRLPLLFRKAFRVEFDVIPTGEGKGSFLIEDPEKLHILFDKENVKNTIGEYVSSLGLSQLRIAETEKYAHVTFFLNGGREDKFPGEDRILVASPKVATYDLKPEMSAYEVKDKLVEALGTQKFDFICLNFANGDMVGHTGVYEAIEKAVLAVDECVSAVVEAAKANGYEVVMIADHGNADHAINADGTPNTAHSLNPVPIVVVSDRVKTVHNGILADVAPTVLKLMGLKQPAEMTGKPLVEMK